MLGLVIKEEYNSLFPPPSDEPLVAFCRARDYIDRMFTDVQKQRYAAYRQMKSQCVVAKLYLRVTCRVFNRKCKFSA